MSDQVVGLLWEGVQAAGALTLLVALMGAFVRWPMAAMVFLSLSVLVLWEWPAPPALVSVGGAAVYPNDVLVIAMVGAAGINLIRNTVRRGALFNVAALVTLLLLVSLLRGISDNGVGSAINEARSILFVPLVFLWALSVDWSQRGDKDRLLRVWSVATGIALTTLGFYHAIRYGVGAADEFVDVGGETHSGRILVSAQALVLAMCIFVVVATATQRHWARSALAVVPMAVVLVLSQQRSVLVAVAVALVVAFFRAGLVKKVQALFLGVAAGIVVLVIAVFVDGNVTSKLLQSASSAGTYEGRTAAWSSLIDASVEQGLPTILFGASMGSGWRRLDEDGVWVEYSPHNWYVSIYLRIGLVGLIALVVWCFAMFARALRRDANAAAIVVAVTLIVFGWGYSWPFQAMGVLGMLLAVTTGASDPTPGKPRESKIGSSSYRRQPIARS
ncbi:O-antigen ligase family protein [Demequina sediminicola]|uniref:O-antigen ligase family protein n=1 Tax=Demequina sediminicola TaxID=1095026 RepID=UPI0007809E36|nr:O-antigen ligase family protein [Demequina sediminicola]